MNVENKSKVESTSPSNDASGSVPSGFILKLYQMVNGAPDEVISVSAFFCRTRRKTVPSSAECLNVFDFFVRNSLAVSHVSMCDVSSCQKDGKNLRIVSLCPNRIFVLR